MCGIAGFQGEFEEQLLDAMGSTIRHRGPDAYGQVLLKTSGRMPVGFAHRRLAIIDLSPEANQPLSVACNVCGAHSLADLALVFNGEIYNFRELRRELLEQGHNFVTRSDS